MLDPQKTLEHEALLKRHREIQAELAHFRQTWHCTIGQRILITLRALQVHTDLPSVRWF